MRRNETIITLSCKQLFEAARFGAPDENDNDQLETEISIAWFNDGHSGAGYYAYYSDLPEEGCIFLPHQTEPQ